jgi:plastocyanin
VCIWVAIPARHKWHFFEGASGYHLSITLNDLLTPRFISWIVKGCCHELVGERVSHNPCEQMKTPNRTFKGKGKTMTSSANLSHALLRHFGGLSPVQYLRHVVLTLLALGLAPAWAGDVQLVITDAAGKPLANAVAFLDSPDAKALVKPKTGIEVEQVERQFRPRVALVPVGSQVSFPNRDKVRHHVYSFSPAKAFDLKLYTREPANPVLFDQPGVVVLGCNIHDQMLSWILVLETPYYGTAGADGHLTLTGVPPGNYRLKVWHEGLPPGSPAQEQAVAVSAGTINVRTALEGVAS